MGLKVAKAHRTIYTILLNGIGELSSSFNCEQHNYLTFNRKGGARQKNVLRINQTRYQFHFEAYI